MSILTELAKRVGSLRFARDLLVGRATTVPWWERPDPIADGMRDIFNERLSPEQEKAGTAELGRVLKDK